MTNVIIINDHCVVPLDIDSLRYSVSSERNKDLPNFGLSRSDRQASATRVSKLIKNREHYLRYAFRAVHNDQFASEMDRRGINSVRSCVQ